MLKQTEKEVNKAKVKSEVDSGISLFPEPSGKWGRKANIALKINV